MSCRSQTLFLTRMPHTLDSRSYRWLRRMIQFKEKSQSQACHLPHRCARPTPADAIQQRDVYCSADKHRQSVCFGQAEL